METEEEDLTVKYDRIVKKLFTTDDGKFVLAIMKNWFVDTSCLTKVSEHTHYMLGKKEFVLELLEIVDKELSDADECNGNIKLDGDILDD